MNEDYDPDVAAAAFASLGRELELLRGAVEQMAAERDDRPELPDYTETLGHMAKAIAATAARVDVLAKAAENNVTPRHVADRIVAASAGAREEDCRAIRGLEDVTRQLQGYVMSARAGDEQNRWLAWSMVAGTIMGIVLWTLLAGPILRATPDSWHWPEKIAAHMLFMPMWEGGQAMMRAASPEALADMQSGYQIFIANREAIETCRERANRAREAVRCTIDVKADGGAGQ